MVGLQLMWNKGKPLSIDKKWNPFARNIPWLTFASHPLFWHKGKWMWYYRFFSLLFSFRLNFDLTQNISQVQMQRK